MQEIPGDLDRKRLTAVRMNTWRFWAGQKEASKMLCSDRFH